MASEKLIARFESKLDARATQLEAELGKIRTEIGGFTRTLIAVAIVAAAQARTPAIGISVLSLPSPHQSILEQLLHLPAMIGPNSSLETASNLGRERRDAELVA